MRRQKLKNIIAIGLVVAVSASAISCGKTSSAVEDKKTTSKQDKVETTTSIDDKDDKKEETQKEEVEVKPQENVTSTINGQFCYYTLMTYNEIKNGVVRNVDTILNVRVEPSLTATVVDKLTNGTAVKVLGKAGDWYQIDLNGTVAFVHSNYVQVDGIEYKFTHDINERPYTTSRPTSGSVSGRPTSSDDKKPSKPSTPSKPSQSVKPSVPVKPVEPPVKPSEPVKPVEPPVVNEAPVITGLDLVITGLGTEFKIADLNLKATDKEDGDITHKIQVIRSNVDTSKAGNYEVTVSVKDSKGLETTLTLKVTVVEKEEDIPATKLNYAPVITGMNVNIKQNSVFEISMLNIIAEDEEDGDLEYEVVSNNVDVANPGSYQVKVVAVDSQGATTYRTFDVVVEPVETEKPEKPPVDAGVINHAPQVTVANNTVSVVKGTELDLSLFDVKATDNEDGTLEVQYEGVPSTSEVGTFEFKAYAVDKQGAKTVKNLTLVVVEKQADLNQAPVLTVANPTVTVLKGDVVTLENFGVKATDAEDGDLEVKYDAIPSTDKVGTFNFVVYAVDKEGSKTSKTLTLVVNERQTAVNNAPVINVEKDVVTVKVGAQVSLADFGITATDVEDGTLEITSDELPSTANAGTFKFFVYATDKEGAKTSKELTLEVVKENTAPVITANNVTINLGEPWDLSMHNIKAVDSNGKDITDRVQVETNCDGTRHGVFPIIITVTDDAGLSSTLTVNAIINSVPPTVNVQEYYEIPLYSSFNIYTDIPVTATDVFGNKVTDIQFSGEVNTNVAGEYTVTVTVMDKLYQKTVKTVTVKVVRPEGLMSVFSSEFTQVVTQEMDRLVNQYRVDNGRLPVKVQDFAIECAGLKAQHMMDNNYFDHTYEGKFIWQMYPKYAELGVCGENILKMNIRVDKDYSVEEAKNFANTMFTLWKESSAHRAMMLSDWNTGYGFAFRITPDGTVYGVQEWVVE